MRYLAIIIIVLGMASCTQPTISAELSHMRKSQAISAIMQNMDLLHYDDSRSEIDRDRLKWSYAKDFYSEVSGLIKNLKHEPPAQTTKDYTSIIKLLQANMRQLKKIIDLEQNTMLLPTLKMTQNTCTQCHILFEVP